jgi:hypothetical protein
LAIFTSSSTSVMFSLPVDMAATAAGMAAGTTGSNRRSVKCHLLSDSRCSNMATPWKEVKSQGHTSHTQWVAQAPVLAMLQHKLEKGRLSCNSICPSAATHTGLAQQQQVGPLR